MPSCTPAVNGRARRAKVRRAHAAPSIRQYPLSNRPAGCHAEALESRVLFAVTVLKTVVNPANGHQYDLLSTSNWTDAEAAAVNLGGHLVTINDPAEDTFVSQQFGDHDYLWTGLNDIGHNGQYTWTDGEPLSYTNWYTSEPNGLGVEHYVLIYAFISGGPWNNFTDDASFPAGGQSGGTLFPIYGVAEVASPTPTPTPTPVPTPTPGAPPLPTPGITRAIGALEPTFGTSGTIRKQLGFTTTAGVRQQDDGKIIVAGDAGAADSRDISLARLNSDGSSDTTFGTSNGTIVQDIRSTAQPGSPPADDKVSAFQVLDSGKILVAGTTSEVSGGITVGSDFFLVKFNADGSLDTTFNGTGVVITDFSADAAGHPSTDGAQDLLVQADGRIVVAGRSDATGAGNTDFAIARYNTDGSLDTTFGGTGKVLTDFSGGDDSAQGIAVTTGGALLAAGYATSGSVSMVALAQFTTAGILDKKFGSGGEVVTSAGGTDERANSVALGAKGTIVVAGSSGSGDVTAGTFSSDFIVARYSSKGAIDRKFGTAGIARASFGQPANATGVEVLADGRVLASGVISTAVAAGQTGRLDLALARFTTTGAADPTFSDDGKAIVTTAAVLPGIVRGSPAAAPLPGTPAANLQDFLDSEEGKVSASQGGGRALLAGTDGDETVLADVVDSGAELSGVLSVKVPTSVIGGATGSAVVSVSDLGDLGATGTMDIQFYVSTDQTLDAADTFFFKLTNQKVNLKPLTSRGKAQSYKAKFVLPTNVDDGAYYILAEVNAQRTITELDPNNDTTFTTATVQIAKPFVDLTGQPLVGNTALVASHTDAFTATLTNDGNILLKANAGVQFVLSTDATLDAGDTTITPALVAKLALKPLGSKPFKFSVPVPALPAGNYYVFIQLDPTNAITEKNEANNVLSTAQPFTVA